MTTDDPLDPLIHVPARLRIVVTLAALHEGDALSFTRLQNLIGLTPGNLITHLRKLEDAGYLSSEKTGSNGAAVAHLGSADPARPRGAWRVHHRPPQAPRRGPTGQEAPTQPRQRERQAEA